METRKRLTVNGILILTVLITLALGVGIALAQDTTPKENIDGPSEPEDITAVAGAIPIQGRLTDDSGNPLDGSYSIRARIYDASSGGTTLCDDTDSISVDNGLFNMYLDGASGCSASDIDGKQLYLGITVGSDTEMYPRQGIYPVPYAWGLRPGAIISNTTNTTLFSVENGGTGTAIVGESENGVSVYGAAYGSQPAIQGIGWGDGRGVEGASYDSSGVGVRGITRNSGSGIWGDSDWIAVYAESISSYGVYAETDLGTNNYGLYTPDNIYSLNYHLAGAIMHVVQNGGEEALEPGDVVVFSGMAAPLEEGGPPVIQVAPATSANSTAVAGVVYRRFDAQALQARPQAEQPEGGLPVEVTPEGPVPAGDYLLLVVEGPAQVKASALGEAIRPGDLLSSVGRAGLAAKAAEVDYGAVKAAMPGTVLGKALEPLDEGQALIYIYVTLQ